MKSSKQDRTLKPLPSELRSIVRSGIAINTVAQCVEELVYNSIDAGAKSVHIGVNLEQFNVRVDDDGNGLAEVDLEMVGVRYNTSKCGSLVDLNNLRYYGFRGEALSSIVDISNTVDIITRPKATAGVELKKKFENGVVNGFVEKYNTATKTSGTSVIVGKLLSKLPVRQKRIDKSIQLEEVKSSLEHIVLVNPHLRIELRNEKNGTQLFKFTPTSSYSDAVNQIFKSQIGFEVKFIQEHFLHKKLFFNLSVCNDFVKKKYYQFVFLNSRFIRRCKIHKWLGNYILDRRKDSSSPKSDRYPIFILNITCPFGEYDITVEPKKQVVEFKDWDDVLNGIDGLVLKLKHKNSFSHVTCNNESIDKNVSVISSRDVKGALHSRFIARESKDEPSSKGSCTDSDRGSLERNSLPKPDKKKTSRTRDRNLSRSGHSTHVVNVREIRKKRKLEANIVALPKPKALKSKVSPAPNKPALTLNAFKSFPEWEGEFDKSGPLPPKRFKDSHNQENYKHYRPDVYSREKDIQTEQNAESQNLEWKMNRFYQDYQQGPNETIDEEFERPLGGSVHTVDSSQQQQSKTHLESVAIAKNAAPICHKSPDVPLKDKLPITSAENFIFSSTEQIIKEKLGDKWTFNHVKEDILKRLFKFYKATKNVKIKKIFVDSPNAGDNQTTAPSATTVKPPTNDFKRTPQDANTSTGFSIPANVINGNNLYSQQDVKRLPSNSDIHNKFNCVSATVTSNDYSKQGILEAAPESSTSCVPPLLDLFPIQKSFSSEWNDQMISNDYNETDNSLFPPDWTAEIIMDRLGQEWLQTLDNNGRHIFINLSSGESSYGIDHVAGSLRKLTVGEMKSNPVRYNWLRRHFPRGFKQFWNGSSREIAKEGDLTRLNNTVLGDSLLKCINQQNPNEQLSKWTEAELLNVSKYFSGMNGSESSIKTVNNATATGIQCWKDLGGTTSSFRFSKEDFALIRVIGQCDRKFIIACIRKSSAEPGTLVMFDQHAVHERIRLENLIASAFKTSKSAIKYLKDLEVMPPYQLYLSETDVRIMQSYVEFFLQAALKFDTVSSTSVKINSVPKCFIEKCANEPTASKEVTFRNLCLGLIQELIHTILETKVAGLTALPKAVHSVLCSQACHGAIKFGDELNVEACKQLIVELRSCKNPFQCAHGRPTVVPLIRGDDMLKVSAAGSTCFQDRRSLPAKIDNLPPPHLECSKYFYDPAEEKTSNYFSFLEGSSLSTHCNNDTTKGSQIHFLGTNDKITNQSTTSDFFSLVSGGNPFRVEDDEESPYFFRVP